MDTKQILAGLNTAQQEAVEKTAGPVLVLAGAGSGKTKVLTQKLCYILSNNLALPSEILMVTFTNKAAAEMKERVVKLLGRDANMPFMGTFHSYGARFLRIEAQHTGLSSNFVIYDEKDSIALISTVMEELNINSKTTKPQAVKYNISSAKNEMVGSRDYAGYARGYFQETVAKIYNAYEQKMLEVNAVDFDDLLKKVVDLLKTNEEVKNKYSGRYKYVLVDEYQDVNAAQYQLTKILSAKHGNITVVGDASQAIYAFRGADFRNIVNFEKDFSDVTVINLEENYRSTNTILSAANAVISQNRSHPVLKLWTKNGQGELIRLIQAPEEQAEGNIIASIIINSGRNYSDFAILYRTNAQSRSIEEALIKNGVAYNLVGGVRFYDRKEIKDVLSYLRIIANDKDIIARDRIIKLGKRKYQAFLARVDEINYPAAELRGIPSEKYVLGHSDHKINKELSPSEILASVLEISEYLLRFDEKDPEDVSRVENIRELSSVAEKFSNLDEFLENVALMESGATSGETIGEKKSEVTLMTIHAAKGLEFPVVFMSGMEEGLFPHSRSLIDPAQLEEERRLCYVGMTRAKEVLFLTYTANRLYFGVRGNSVPSRFLGDLPEDLVKNLV